VRLSKVPVTGIVEGAAASAATIFLMGCAKRQMTPSSMMLIHQVSSCFWGTAEQWKDEHRNMDKLMSKIRKIYALHSSLPEPKIQQLLTRDLWWSAKKCSKYGLVDEILKFSDT
jgi:ATP-dependent protease ClpP protease subunit